MFDLFETGFSGLTWGNLVMLAVGLTFIWLAITKKWEPYELLPIGAGMILANLPGTGLLVQPYQVGGEFGSAGLLGILIEYSLLRYTVLPLLIFLCLGAMTDFGPLLANPKLFLLGAAAQVGIFIAFFGALALGHFGIADFGLREAACIGIIGGADGPTTIYLTSQLAPEFMGITAVAAYSYMAMVALIQPPIIKALTSKKERQTYMKPQLREVSNLEVILFPIVVFIVAALLVPKSVPLIGMFMFGNLLRASGVTDRLAQSAGGVFIDVLTFLLGITVGALMPASVFLQPQTLAIIGLAVVAFAFGTAGGLWAAQLINLFLKEKINPMIGAAGVSAIPMSARVVQRLGQKENPRNFLLMHAMGPNMAGAVATSLVAGIFLGMLG